MTERDGSEDDGGTGEPIAELLAHAVNNPLGYVLANLTHALEQAQASRASGTATSQELVDALAEALEGAQRLHAMVDGLLASRTFPLQKQPDRRAASATDDVTATAGTSTGAAATASPGTAAPTASGASPRRGRVVVIDDEELITRVVERILRSDHDVVCFLDPAVAVAHLETVPTPDLVLCDLMMPQMTGMEVFERLMVSRAETARRIVFLSGGASSARARAFLQEVTNERLAKPFTAAALRALVRDRVTSVSRGPGDGSGTSKVVP